MTLMLDHVKERMMDAISVNPAYHEPICALENGTLYPGIRSKDAITLEFVRVVPIAKVRCIQGFVVSRVHYTTILTRLY